MANTPPTPVNANRGRLRLHILAKSLPRHAALSVARWTIGQAAAARRAIRQAQSRVVERPVGCGHPGSSTVSMTWITPFDCITLAIVMRATSPF